MGKSVREAAVALARIPGLFLQQRRFWTGLRDITQASFRVIRRPLRGERQERPPRRGDCCIHVPDVYKRPDPLIYAQYYLMSMGLAVTWDNPDIQLFEVDPSRPDGIGAPVPSSALQPDHPYKVQVRVWNGSYDAPAVGLPVHLSYLSFGGGTKSHPVGTTIIDLGVKGSPHHPAFALFDWRTRAAGHYCLQAFLEWWDDANPDNNLGQENVTVGALHSPADFAFALRNEASVRRRFMLEADTYRLRDPIPCDDPRASVPVPEQPGRGGKRPPSRLAESRARWERARREQGYGAFPVPANWAVLIEPHDLVLAPDEEREIRVSIEPRTPDAVAPMAFNVHAFALRDPVGRSLAGGVTLYVTRT